MMLMARRSTPAQKVRRHVALSAAVAALGGLLFGYDTGVVSGALLFLKKDFGGLSSFQEKLVTSLLLVGTVAGALAVVAVLGLLIYTGSFAIGLGPVFWLLIAEIYPLRIRGAAMSVATMANWGANFVVTISFLTLLNAIDGVGVFFLFGFLTLVALGYFWRKVPETRGRGLQEIEQQLTGTAA